MDRELQKHMQEMQQRAIEQCSSLLERLSTWPENGCEDLLLMEVKFSSSLLLIVHQAGCAVGQ